MSFLGTPDPNDRVDLGLKVSDREIQVRDINQTISSPERCPVSRALKRKVSLATDGSRTRTATHSIDQTTPGPTGLSARHTQGEHGKSLATTVVIEGRLSDQLDRSRNCYVRQQPVAFSGGISCFKSHRHRHEGPCSGRGLLPLAPFSPRRRLDLGCHDRAVHVADRSERVVDRAEVAEVPVDEIDPPGRFAR